MHHPAPWFREAAFGMFIHWGPYAMWARGEQVLFREYMDQQAYARKACRWNPRHFDARAWARAAKDAGMKYAVLTTRHHDGYCLWDTKTTDYSSVAQAPKRDFVRAFVEACRAEGIRPGLYYSLVDWRIPAYFEGPRHDPRGWRRFIDYVHEQVRELMSNYGPIDVFWFDGNWPSPAPAWRARELTGMIRRLQPGILINERLNVQQGEPGHDDPAAPPDTGEDYGDFSTPEQHIAADSRRIWESCHTSYWRLWGYTKGEQWRTTHEMLDLLTECASLGGNLILNVGPDEHGRIPKPFLDRTRAIGDWLKVHGEAVYNTDRGDVCEFVTYGRQSRKGNNLYLIIRFWHGGKTLTLGGLETRVKSATLLTTGQPLDFTQTRDHVVVTGLPRRSPTKLFPVIKLECDGEPRPTRWASQRLWTGDPRRMTQWAKARGEGAMVDGSWK